jgi:hypothetical protein
VERKRPALSVFRRGDDHTEIVSTCRDNGHLLMLDNEGDALSAWEARQRWSKEGGAGRPVTMGMVANLGRIGRPL